MRTFIIKPGDLIPIGRAGENQATQIRFDVTGWADTFGAGTYTLVVKRPHEDTAYPVEVTTDGDYVVWTVSNVDTGIAGNASVQLRYVVDGALAKSVIYTGIVGESLDNIVDPPDPFEDLIQRMVDLAERTEAAAESAAGSAASASESAETATAAKTAAEAANTAAQSAKTAAQSANTDAQSAKTAAQSAKNAAEAAQSEAAQSATAASGSATAAAGSAAQAAASATAADASADAAEAVLASIPQDYSALSKDVSDLKTQVKEYNISGLTHITYTTGGYINTGSYSVGDTVPMTVTPGDNRAYALFYCTPGTTLTVTGTSGSFYIVYSFLDENNVLLAKDEASKTRQNLVVTAPAGTAKALVCANTTYPYSCIVGESWKAEMDKDAQAFSDFIGAVPATYKSGYILLGGLNIGDIVDIYSPVQAANRAYSVMDCTSGDVFRFTGTGGSNYRAYAFVDANNALLDVDSVSTVREDYIVFVPQSAAKIIVDTDTAVSYYCVKGLGWKANVDYTSVTPEKTTANHGLKVVNDALSEVSTQAWNYAKYDVTGLSVVKISSTAFGRSSYPCYIFTDDNNATTAGWYAYYTNADVEAYAIDDTITVPAGATKLYVNKHSAGRVDIDVKGKTKELIGQNKVVLSGVYAPDLDITEGEMAEKIVDVVKHNANGAYLNIAFLTDTHANTSNAEDAGKLMHKLSTLDICDLKIHGGDAISTGGVAMDALDFDGYIAEVSKYANAFKQSDLIFLKGNHDGNHNSTLSENATKYQWHMLFQRDVKGAVVDPADPDGNYFYIDDAKHKIRIICLNAFYAMGNSDNINFGSAQVAWLTNTALDLPTGYKAIVFSHAFSSSSEITSVLANAENLIGIIYGHTHIDNYSNANGFNAINVRCAYDTNGGMAVDIFTVDTDNSILYETRFGAGVSRSFSFDNPEMLQ